MHDALNVTSATAHITAAPVQFAGNYQELGDVLYLSTPDDDKHRGCELTPEGHGVRVDDDGRVTHMTIVGAKWFLKQDGEIVATLRDGRRLRLGADDVAGLIG